MQGGGYSCNDGTVAKFEGSDNQVWNKVKIINESLSCQDVSLHNTEALRVNVSPDTMGDFFMVTGKCQNKTLPCQPMLKGLHCC